MSARPARRRPARSLPVLDGREELVDELIGLYTPRNLYAIQTIATKIDAAPATRADRRDLPLGAGRLPAAGVRLNGYPGRVASLRITGGHVRQPASRHQREVNVWRLFEASFRTCGRRSPRSAARASRPASRRTSTTWAA